MNFLNYNFNTGLHCPDLGQQRNTSWFTHPTKSLEPLTSLDPLFLFSSTIVSFLVVFFLM